jgi:hypothetical protein
MLSEVRGSYLVAANCESCASLRSWLKHAGVARLFFVAGWRLEEHSTVNTQLQQTFNRRCAIAIIFYQNGKINRADSKNDIN